MGTLAWFGRFKTAAPWAALIAAVNLVGIAYGFYYYLPQFEATPWYLWIFVPDSPLAVLWAELALALWWLRREVGVFDALAFVGNVQVGLWTVYVLLAYADSFGTYTLNLNTILLAGHAGMALLGLVFVHGLRERRAARPLRVRAAILAAGAYYVVNDLLDYLGPNFPVREGRGPLHACLDYGMRPYTVPCSEPAETALMVVTLLLTTASVGVLWALTRARPRPRAARVAAADDE